MISKRYACVLAASAVLVAPLSMAIEPGQTNSFDVGTEGWQVGNPGNHPAPPEQRNDCGDKGPGDGCLVLTSTGESGPGGRMTVFNTDEWTGNFATAGIAGIAFQAANMGKEDIYLRVRLDSLDGDPLISAQPVLIPADGTYRSGFLKLSGNAFTVFDPKLTEPTIMAVSSFRLFHSADPLFMGPREAHVLYLDDLTAAPIDDVFASGFDFPPTSNDTGITACADASSNGLPCPVAGFPGQDAEFGRDFTDADDADGRAGFSFTKVNGAGNSLPANATTWACVRDNVTGLMWEVKSTDGSFRDADQTFNWYNSDPTTNGGDAGDEGFSCNPAQEICNIEQYVDEINEIGLCGFADWRAPSVAELVGLIDYGAPQEPPQPAIDLNYFPNTPRRSFWSITTSATDGSGAGAFLVDFPTGRTSNASKQIATASFRVTRGKPQ